MVSFLRVLTVLLNSHYPLACFMLQILKIVAKDRKKNLLNQLLTYARFKTEILQRKLRDVACEEKITPKISYTLVINPKKSSKSKKSRKILKISNPRKSSKIPEISKNRENLKNLSTIFTNSEENPGNLLKSQKLLIFMAKMIQILKNIF